ncbi:MAG: prepilin-type N-terminal cleavage/methylation domain-containing protein [Clostridia bacterium]|nr:prepilin-type N-terminal cleavage/methylation domain-containing protein [Clostridia bacterium]
MNSKKGFSVVELIVALALLLIALGLGYNLLFFARSSFDRSEERWMEQNEVVAVSNAIYDSLNEAYYVEIVSGHDNIPTGLDFYGAFYVNDEGHTIYEYFDGDSTTTADLPGENLTLTFNTEKYTINEVDYTYNDLLRMTVVSDVLDYTLDTRIHLDNMNRDRSIEGGIDTGDVVVFQTKAIVETIPGDLYDSMCFVATAAYESPMNPSVRLLRRFRDEYLLETNLGSKFVDFYYRNSPPVAAAISKSPVLRFMARAALYPVVGLVSLIMNPLHLACTLAGIFIAMLFYKKRYLIKGGPRA